ncbi:MAG: hypothetical protein KF753_22175 [Caldilineaceae bacterium]|nr:hypothetical protein [Caldilineaceae bacterium]
MSLYDIFDNLKSDQLKDYMRLCDGPSSLTRKADRANHLVETLTDPVQLRRLWAQMDDLSRKAVAAAYHNDGIFNSTAFVAQYGSLPERPQSDRWSYHREPIMLDLFIHGNEIPAEVMALLAPIVPAPERFQLTGSQTVPDVVDESGEAIEIFVAEREIAGLHDLTLYLTLLSQGTLKLSSSSHRLTPKSVKTLVAGLQQGDLFSDVEKAEEAILPYGLTVFCDQSGLTTYKGTLDELANTFLATNDAHLLLEAFESWAEKGTYDEIDRIQAIRGLRSRGIRLTSPASRREKIMEALSWCPTGVWISIADFYRAIRVWHFDFDLENGTDKLYVGYRGSQRWYESWASAENQWLLTTGLYINTILMEYLAAIGAIDIVYTYPEYEIFPGQAYNYDELIYSRYDGLLYFRINPLGAYLFGQADGYESSQPSASALFSIAPDGSIALLQPDEVSAALQAQLDQITEREGDGYRLSVPKLLAVLESSADLEIQRSFLRHNNRGDIPVEIIALLDKTEADSKALRIATKSLTIQVRSAELTQQVLADPKAGKIARQLDDRTLIIPASRETAFRNALREMGYGLDAGG